MKVAITKCESYKQEKVDLAVTQALKLIDFKFQKGIRVLLKPNVIAPLKPEKAATTHPSILIALCKILKEKNAKVYIGDSSGWPSTVRALKVSGVEKVAKDFDIKLLNFNSQKLVTFKNDKNEILKEVDLPAIIKDLDMIINLPKLKTHVLMGYTGAVKNLFGFIPGGKKGYYHLKTGDAVKLSKLFIELHDFIKPQLTIMDAVVGMEGNGPTTGRPKQTGLIITSKDCLALDIVASEIIGFEPREIPLINEFLKIRDVTVNKQGLERIGVKYKRPFFPYKKIIPKFLTDLEYKKSVRINPLKCKKCLICYEHCPAKAIEHKEHLLAVNLKKCIKCYCCHELCLANAIEIKQSMILKIGKKILRSISKII